MTVRVRLFGPEARALGRGEVAIEAAPGTTCAQLRSDLRARYPQLQDSLSHARFAINSEFADEAREIEPGDEVALIGLVSGG